MRVTTPRDARSLDHAALEELRCLAVARVLAGESQRAVAASLQVHFNTVCKWQRTYRAEGSRGLASTKAGGPVEKLTLKQQRRLVRLVVGKDPQQLNVGPALWTRAVVGDLIAKEFGVVLHESTVSRMLHRLGITPQLPTRQALQRNDEDVRRWSEDEFPQIVADCQKRQATLLFLDETGVHEDAPIGTTWGKRGQTPIVKLSGTRRRINVISAISPRGRLWFRCYQEALDAPLFLAFLKSLLHDVAAPIVVVMDKHPAHKAALVKRYLQEQRGRIRVHYLPSYAPDLNPDEHVWAALKGLYRRDPLGQEECIEPSVTRAMRQIARDRAWVKSFFGHPGVAYVKTALSW